MPTAHEHRQLLASDFLEKKQDRQHHEIFAISRNAMWFALAAVIVSLVFGAWDALGDRAWQADQLELLQEISHKLDQAARLNELEQKQLLLDETVQQIGKDLKNFSE